MKKILFIIPTLSQTNGVAAFMINYIKNMKLDSISVEILYNNFRTSEYYVEILNKCNVKLYSLHYVRNVGFKKYCNEINEFFSIHNDYDLIYSNVSYQSYYFFKYAKKYGVTNFAIHSHATTLSDNKYKNFIGKLLHKKVNKLCQNKFACSKLAGKAIFKNEKFTVINNAIDYDKFKFNSQVREKIRKEYKIKSDEKLIGFIGRFVPQKNIFFFIKLMQKLPQNFKLIMIGSGFQKSEFINKVEEENLTKRFVFVDEVINSNEFYSAFDYFALPSLYEGLPVVGVEAQANGLLCLFSNTISDECKISDNILYLDNNNVNLWVEHLKSNKGNRENDKIKLDDKFNIKIQALDFENQLKNLIKE